MTRDRAVLEAEFLRLCRERGPVWIESVIRPLRLRGNLVTVRDIPDSALRSIAQVFGRSRKRLPGALAQ